MRQLNIHYLVALSLSCASSVHAQEVLNSKAAPLYPWYAAVQLADHSFEIVVPGTAPGITGVSPYQLTIGRYLTSRWAIQASYSAYHLLIETTNYGTTVTGEPTSYQLYAEDWVKAVPILLRYRLTHNQAHRLQFDGSLGTTLVVYRDKQETTSTTSGQVVNQHSWGGHAVNGYLTLGPAVSYRFSRHLQACFDLLLTKNLHSIDRTFSTQQLNSTLGFQHGWSLGLRYGFQVKRRAQ
jgi:hypothetical protein